MANEATIRASLTVRKGNLYFAPQPTGFNASINAANPFGPDPGAIVATISGTDVIFAGFTLWPSLCWVQNLDTVNLVTVGIWDPVTHVFYPLLELGPGEAYPLRLSRYLGRDYTTGTGTFHVPGPNDSPRLRIKADHANCFVIVQAIDN